jgi:hypothetical protein
LLGLPLEWSPVPPLADERCDRMKRSIIAAVPVLLFIGIRNAWDVVTYMAIERAQPQNTSQD